MNIEHLHGLFIASDGISTDTRKLVPNTLFFALKGDHFNGNQFAAKALAEGCSYAIVDEKEYAVFTDSKRKNSWMPVPSTSMTI